MPRPRHLLTLALALAASLAAAAPALAGGVVSVADGTLAYTGDDREPNNVTISLAGGAVRLDEDGSRMTLGAGAEACTLSDDRYRAECPAAGVERLLVRTSATAGSDVRVRADLPAEIHGGAADDVLLGGPGDDVIRGGGGMDVIGGGPGADELHGGEGEDLVTYRDRLGRGDALLPRREGVTVRLDPDEPSGARGEDDRIASDFEQVEGGAGNDRFELRDRRVQALACGAGRDVALLDPADVAGIDCERSSIDARGAGRGFVPTLVYPFPDRDEAGRGLVTVAGTLPLRRGAVVVRIRCERPIGLLAADGPGCNGTVRMARAGGDAMAARRVSLARGRTTTWRVPLSSSRALARRPQGLDVVVSALPRRGEGVRRDMRFTVKG